MSTMINGNLLLENDELRTFVNDCLQERIALLGKSSTATNKSISTSKFTIKDEFYGLGKILPIDIAVYCNDEIIAFVEVDGEHHKNRVREDKLKEYLYNKKYQNVSLYRIDIDEIKSIGEKEATKIIAKKILTKIQKYSM